MSQIEHPSAKFKQISWSWLFLSLLAFITIYSQVIGSYNTNSKKKTDYLEEKIILDQVILQKTQEKINQPLLKSSESNFNSLLDVSISSLIEDKNKIPEAAVLYAVMRYEQGYNIDSDSISILANHKNKRYSSIYEIYTQAKGDLGRLRSLIPLFQNNNLVDRLICIHIYEKSGDFQQRQKILPLQYWSKLIQVTTSYIFIGTLGLVLIFIYQFKRKKGYWVPAGISFIPSNFYEFNQQGKKILAMTMLLILMPVALMAFSNKLIGFLLFIIFIATLGFLKWSKDLSFKSLEGKINLLSQLKWGLGASFANIPVIGLFGLLSILLQSFFPSMSHSATDIILKGNDSEKMMVMAFLACIVAPIIEEILFRGLILPSLIYRYKSPLWGIIVTNFIFAAVHPQGIAGWPALFAVGTMASLMFIQTGAILPSIILHMVHNGGLLIMTYILSMHL